MKIFITGGNGFIGRNLREPLGCKYDIAAPSSSELNLIDDGKVADFIKRHKFDVIIHAANWNPTLKSKKDSTRIIEYNLRMFFNIVRCSEHYGKLIYFGSGAEYGRTHWIPKIDEEYFDKHVPGEDYGFSKYLMTKYVEKAGNIYNLRLFGVFGKYEDWKTRFISNACCKAVYGLPITIRQNVFFDYLYVDDLVKITDLFITNEPREKAYNICTGTVCDLLTLAKKVVNASGKRIDIVIAKPGLGNEYSGNNAKFTDEFGEFAFSDMDANIKYLYDWYVANKHMIDREELISESSINFESGTFTKYQK